MTTLFLPAASSAEVIRVGGSGGPLTVFAVLADNFSGRFPGVQFDILSSLGSGGSVRALNNGAIDIAITSRPLTAEERTTGVKERILGLTPFVVVTSKPTGLSNLSLQQLAAIYRGDMDTWPDDTPIRLVLRPKTDSDFAALGAMSSEMEQAVRAAILRKGMIFASTDNENTEILERTPGSLGTSTLAQILAEKRDFLTLKIEGTTPTLQSLEDGTYRFSKSFYAVTKGDPSGLASSFLTYVFSQEGMQVLRQLGCIQP